MCSTECRNEVHFAKLLWSCSVRVFHYYLFFTIWKVNAIAIALYLVQKKWKPILDNTSIILPLLLKVSILLSDLFCTFWGHLEDILSLNVQNSWPLDDPNQVTGRMVRKSSIWAINFLMEYFRYLHLKWKLWEKMLSYTSSGIQDKHNIQRS